MRVPGRGSAWVGVVSIAIAASCSSRRSTQGVEPSKWLNDARWDWPGRDDLTDPATVRRVEGLVTRLGRGGQVLSSACTKAAREGGFCQSAGANRLQHRVMA